MRCMCNPVNSHGIRHRPGSPSSLVTCWDEANSSHVKGVLAIRSIFALFPIKVLKSKANLGMSIRLAFSLRFSSFLRDGNGIDALGIGVKHQEHSFDLVFDVSQQCIYWLYVISSKSVLDTPCTCLRERTIGRSIPELAWLKLAAAAWDHILLNVFMVQLAGSGWEVLIRMTLPTRYQTLFKRFYGCGSWGFGSFYPELMPETCLEFSNISEMLGGRACTHFTTTAFVS
ncbi:hypothetical protein Tco_1263525 [Tanacetum coccineum]